MEERDKELLLTDLCGRLPYGVICRFTDTFDGCEVDNVLHPDDMTDMFRHRSHCDSRIDVKPYLRPMSSMTEEEIIEFNNIPSTKNYTIIENDLPWGVAHYKQIDWLNKKMFDFRGLIPKGLALSTDEFNPYKD